MPEADIELVTPDAEPLDVTGLDVPGKGEKELFVVEAAVESLGVLAVGEVDEPTVGLEGADVSTVSLGG